MTPTPGPYSGKSTLAMVARVSCFTVGLVYGNMKMKYLRAKAKSNKKAEAKASLMGRIMHFYLPTEIINDNQRI